MCKPNNSLIISENYKKIMEGKHILENSSNFFSEKYRKCVLSGVNELIVKMYSLINVHKPDEKTIIDIQNGVLDYLAVHL